jgi:hypothetical protein
MKITLILSPRFHEWCRENPEEILARALNDTETLVCEMAPDVFAGLRERMRREGGSLAEWLISSDDFVTDVSIAP